MKHMMMMMIDHDDDDIQSHSYQSVGSRVDAHGWLATDGGQAN